MLYIERKAATESSYVKVVREQNDSNELLPIGYYTCSNTGIITHIVNPEEDNDGIMIWVYSEKLYSFYFSEKTVKMPIVIRKGKDLFLASFRNFEYVYKNVYEDTGIFNAVERSITLFDPEMYRYTISISIHYTTGVNPFKYPWMFYEDTMRRSKIKAPSESARRALNVSYEINVGGIVKTLYCYLFSMGGNYYCKSISEFDPMLSKEAEISGFKKSKLSDEKMTIRFRKFDKQVVVVGGYYDPKKYKKMMYYLAEREIPDVEMRHKFYKQMKTHKLRTYTILRRYTEMSEEILLKTKDELKKTYKEDLMRKIRNFLELN